MRLLKNSTQIKKSCRLFEKTAFFTDRARMLDNHPKKRRMQMGIIITATAIALLIIGFTMILKGNSKENGQPSEETISSPGNISI